MLSYGYMFEVLYCHSFKRPIHDLVFIIVQLILSIVIRIGIEEFDITFVHSETKKKLSRLTKLI